MLMAILALVVVGCCIAFFKWRWGVFAAILIGLLQDPLRKMVPGVPGYLAMTTMPVWITVLVAALVSGDLRPRLFLSRFPRLGSAVSIFGLYLLIPAALAVSYGHNTWMIALLGGVIYASAFLMVLCGWTFPGVFCSLHGVLFFYCCCAAVMLVGGPLDYFGLAKGVAAIGTEAMGKIWVTYRMGSSGVFMYAGFFRSPDVMGWHAALVSMIAAIFAVRSRGVVRWFWIGIAVWGVLNLWICGRRKMIAMLPLFLGSLLVLTGVIRGMRRAVLLGGALAVFVGMAWYGVARTYEVSEVDAFYGSTLRDVDDRVVQHGVKAVVTTIRQGGFWGYGLGMGQQGVHHIPADKPRLWQEGGPAKIIAELGVPGGILLVYMGIVLSVTLYQVVAMPRTDQSFYTFAGLFAILIANIASAVVSAQIFGDPFILLLLAFLAGSVLSGRRSVASAMELPMSGES
jgi:hypothetical protein